MRKRGEPNVQPLSLAERREAAAKREAELVFILGGAVFELYLQQTVGTSTWLPSATLPADSAVGDDESAPEQSAPR